MSKHLDIVWTNQFKKDYKLAMKRHLDIELLDNIIRKLASGEQLPEKKEFSPSSAQGPWPCLRLDFRLQASRTMRE